MAGITYSTYLCTGATKRGGDDICRICRICQVRFSIQQHIFSGRGGTLRPPPITPGSKYFWMQAGFCFQAPPPPPPYLSWHFWCYNIVGRLVDAPQQTSLLGHNLGHKGGGVMGCRYLLHWGEPSIANPVRRGHCQRHALRRARPALANKTQTWQQNKTKRGGARGQKHAGVRGFDWWMDQHSCDPIGALSYIQSRTGSSMCVHSETL